MIADVWWCRSGTGIGYLQEFCFQSCVECSRGECERRIGEIKRWVRRCYILRDTLLQWFTNFLGCGPLLLINICRGPLTAWPILTIFRHKPILCQETYS